MKKTNLIFSLLLLTISIVIISCNNEKDKSNKDTDGLVGSKDLKGEDIDGKGNGEQEKNVAIIDESNFSNEIQNIEDSISYVIGMNIGNSFLLDFPEINFSIFKKGLSDHLKNSPTPLIDKAAGQQLLQKYFMLKQANANTDSPKIEPSLNKSNNIQTLEDSVSYVVGNNIGENILAQFPECNPILLKKGMKNRLYKNSEVLIDSLTGQQIVESYFRKKQQIQQDKQKANLAPKIKEGEDFLANNSKKEGVVTLPSGLQYKVIKNGTGPKPSLQDKVLAHYHGTLIDGTVFDSSVDRGEPTSFPVNGVIPGWIEALQLMSVGSKWQLYIPYQLAYGERGAGQMIGPYSTLIFDVELIKIN